MIAERATKGCLAGKILRVNLSTGRTSTENTEKYAYKTLGGRGINSLIMLNEIEPKTKWDDPDNLLCFGTGSLVGTMAPGSCRTDISTINVFSGGKGSANVGGFWGPELKYAGYDNIIVSGKSKKPVYLHIHDNRIELREASSLWGQTTYETDNILRRELGDEHIKIATIGPAGENRVRGSAIIVDTAKAAGGSGVGCVMGDKRLKAVVLRGHGKIEVADPQGFMKEVAKCYRQCAENESLVLSMRRGTIDLFVDQEFPAWNLEMVARNGQNDYWQKENRIRLMNPETGIPSLRKWVRACASCPTGCMPYWEINKGKHEGLKGEGIWVNTIQSAARFDIDDPEVMIEFWLLANQLGLDTDYITAGLSWVFECYEKGLITKKDTGGLELTWGNGEALIELIKMVAFRQGIGNLLADGMVEAAEKIGGGSEYYLIHMKGQPSQESYRILKGWGLAVSTSPVAGRHLRGATQGPGHFGPPGLDFKATEYRNQPKAVFWQGKTKELEDSLGICSYIGTWIGAHFLTPANFVGLVNTGMGLNLTEEEMMDHYALLGRNLEKAFNTLHTDLSREDDLPPKRFREEEVKSGPFKGFKADEDKFNEMLDELYGLWGWDRNTGMQTRSGLERLGLKEIADKLARQGKLVDR